jgi:hypothetical protein
MTKGPRSNTLGKGVEAMPRQHMRTLVLLTLIVAVSAGNALALQATLTAGEMSIIANPSREDDVRVLLKYGIPNWLRSSEIIYAQLRGRVVSAVDGAVEIEAVPLTTEWNEGTVTWADPWTTPGGDFDAGLRRAFIVRDGSQPVRIDVTHLVRQWAHGERGNLGLMLKTSHLSTGTFELARSREGGGPYAEPVIKIWYLPLVE